MSTKTEDNSFNLFHIRPQNVKNISPAITQFVNCANKINTEQSRRKGHELRVHEDDVFVATPLKCGTTWTQQIMHSLRSRGDMSFEEISNTIPCIEVAHDIGITDLQADQGYRPRCFKTHFWYPDCPKGGRYIVVVRDPIEATRSFYHFLEHWFFEEGTITMGQFVEEFILAAGEAPNYKHYSSIWHVIASWYPHRNDANVLWLHYEDLLQDLEGCVREIAAFMPGVDEHDEELIAIAVKQADIEFMKQHMTKYDEHPMKLARNEASGLPRMAGMGTSSKVRGLPKQELPPDTLQAMLDRWAEVMLPATGYASFQEMRQGINGERGRFFTSPV